MHKNAQNNAEMTVFSWVQNCRVLAWCGIVGCGIVECGIVGFWLSAELSGAELSADQI